MSVIQPTQSVVFYEVVQAKSTRKQSAFIIECIHFPSGV